MPSPSSPEQEAPPLGTSVPASRSVAVRLALLSVALAFIIGLVLTSVQVVIDMRHDRQRVQNTIQQVMRTLGEPAEQALYTVDRKLARTVVDGLFKYDSVFRARVEDDYKEIFAERERAIEDSVWRKALRHIFNDQAEFNLPIYSRGRSVGLVAVSVDLFAEMRNFFERALLVFAGGFVRNLVLVACLFTLYHIILVRPLSRLCHDIAAIAPDRSEPSRVTIPERNRFDELGSLVTSTNNLLERFEGVLSERRAAEQALLHHQEDLENIIAERTAALERLVITDPLTNLLNRRGLMEAWHAVKEQAVRTDTTLGVLLLDIDFFKQINDTHGHDVGDRVLLLVADTLTRGIRAYDLCARWGGEEFLIILVDVNHESLLKIGESIRSSLRQAKLDDVPLTMTVSVGATLVSSQDSLDQAVGRADMAMYEVKRSGRDALRVFGGMPPA